MALIALVAVALAVAVIAGAGAWWAARSASRRAQAALAPVVGVSGTLDEALARVAGAYAALSERAERAEGMADRLTDALSTVPEGVIVCDEHGQVWFRNEVAQMFAAARHGEVLADLTVVELLDAALHLSTGTPSSSLASPPHTSPHTSAHPSGQYPLQYASQYPSQYLELYGPPR